MAWAERYATGGTQHRRPRAERYTDAGHGLDDPGAERYATGGTQHRRLRRNAIPMPGHGLDGPGVERYATRAERNIDAPGGTLCHWYW